MTTPTPVLPIGGEFESAIDRPIARAALIRVADLGSELVSARDVQNALASIVQQLAALDPNSGEGGQQREVVTGVSVTPGTAGVAGAGPLYAEAFLQNPVSIPNPTANAPQAADWTDIFSHTVTAAEAARGYILLDTEVWCEIASDSDEGGNRPALAVRLIKGSTELAQGVRYYRFSSNTPLPVDVSAVTSVAEGDVIKVQGQFFRLAAAAAALGASCTIASRFSRFSPALPGSPATPTSVQVTTGNITEGGGGAVIGAATDATLTGDGLRGTPLSVAIPYTAVDRDKLAALPPVRQLPRVVTALSAAPQAGDVEILGGVVWRAGVIAGGTAIDLTMRQGVDPASGEDDTGYRRDRYGSIATPGGQHIPWLDDLYAEDEEDSLILRLRSSSDPGNVRLRITRTPENIGGGSYDLTQDAARTAYEISTPNGRQYESGDYAINPFRLTGDYRLTLTPAGDITYWEAAHQDDVSDWAQSGSGLVIPLPKMPGELVRISQLTAMSGLLEVTDTAGVLSAVGRGGSVTPAMLNAVNRTGTYILTYNRDATGFDSLHPSRLAPVDGTTIRFTAANELEVIHPYTPAAIAKLAGIEAGATADQTAAEIKGLLETLQGNARLRALAIAGLHGVATAGVLTDATLTGDGGSATRLSVAEPYTAAERAKLAVIEAGATADQTAAEIKGLYESNPNTNAFTDALLLKLSGIAAGAHADGQTVAQVNALIQAYGLPFTAGDHAKLDGIEAGATADQTAAEIKTLYESNSDTNALTDALVTAIGAAQTAAQVQTALEAYGVPFAAADRTKLDGIEDGATADQTAAEVVTLLESLSGTARLPASAVQGLHEAATGGVSSDATLSGDGTVDSPLSVAVVRFFATAALMNADAAPVAGSVALVHGDTPANNGWYFRSNTSWDALRTEGRINALADARVQAAKSTSLPLAPASDAVIGSSAQWAVADHVHPEQAIAAGYTDAEADARVRAYTGQATPTGAIELNRMPPSLERLGQADQSGGLQRLTDGSIQIAGDLQGSALGTIGDGQAWGSEVIRSQGISPGANPWIRGRVRRTEYPALPTPADLSAIRITPEPTGDPADPEIRPGIMTVAARTAPADADAAQYLYCWFQIAAPNWPVSAAIYLKYLERHTLGIPPSDGLVEPRTLNLEPDALMPDRIPVFSNETIFKSIHGGDQRELLDGTVTGVSLVSGVNNDSAISLTALTESLDLDTEPHGILGGAFTLTLSNRSSVVLGLAPSSAASNPNLSVTVPFTHTIEAIAATAPYNTTRTTYGLTLASADVFRGTERVGVVLIRAHRDDHNAVGLNVQYLAEAGHSYNDRADVGIQGDVIVIGTGAPRGLGGGEWYQFETLPAMDEAHNFAPGTLLLVYGDNANRGAWRVERTETQTAADTGLAGKTLNPRDDLVAGQSGGNDHLYYIATGADALNSDLTASGQWADAPTALRYIDLHYRHNTEDDGALRLTFASARTYTGAIVIRTPGRAIRLTRTSATVWFIDGLTVGEVRDLERNQWTFSEPDVDTYTVSYSFTRILEAAPAQGTETLLDAATDTVQRTWPASVLAGLSFSYELVLTADLTATTMRYTLTADERAVIQTAGVFILEFIANGRHFSTLMVKGAATATAQYLQLHCEGGGAGGGNIEVSYSTATASISRDSGLAGGIYKIYRVG